MQIIDFFLLLAWAMGTIVIVLFLSKHQMWYAVANALILLLAVLFWIESDGDG